MTPKTAAENIRKQRASAAAKTVKPGRVLDFILTRIAANSPTSYHELARQGIAYNRVRETVAELRGRGHVTVKDRDHKGIYITEAGRAAAGARK